MKRKVRILEIGQVTPDVKRFVVERPENYEFIPGQATRVSINKPGWRYEERPFTFTSLNSDPHLEFIIKKYPQHHGVTEKLHSLSAGDELIIRDVFGAIKYSGKGVFIAGGAGITPFIAILRQLKKENSILSNRLFFSNKTEKDIILKQELEEMFGQNPGDLVFVVSDENNPKYYNGFINEDFLKKQIDSFNQKFYICGPPKMTEQLITTLKKLGADINSVVFEK